MTTIQLAGHAYSQRPRLRLTRRGRAVLTVLAAIPVAAGGFLLSLGGSPAGASGEVPATAYHYVSVEPGQSLWQIARTVAPADDPRDVIAAIVRLNALEGTVVVPGEQLAIPVQYSH